MLRHVLSAACACALAAATALPCSAADYPPDLEEQTIGGFRLKVKTFPDSDPLIFRKVRRDLMFMGVSRKFNGKGVFLLFMPDPKGGGFMYMISAFKGGTIVEGGIRSMIEVYKSDCWNRRFRLESRAGYDGYFIEGRRLVAGDVSEGWIEARPGDLRTDAFELSCRR